MGIIKETRDFLDGPETGPPITIQSLTYVAEIVGENDPLKGKIVGTGRLIKTPDSPETKPVMYIETENGLELTQLEHHMGGSIELAGMVVDPDHEKESVGKAITVMRALIARKFVGLFGADTIIVEFLPPYIYNETKENEFWNHLILPALKYI